jgi:hypothetical protein
MAETTKTNKKTTMSGLKCCKSGRAKSLRLREILLATAGAYPWIRYLGVWEGVCAGDKPVPHPMTAPDSACVCTSLTRLTLTAGRNEGHQAKFGGASVAALNGLEGIPSIMSWR